MKKTKSILTEYGDICFYCGKPCNTEHHLLFGTARKYAEEDGIKFPICDNHHTQNEVKCRIHGNPMAEKLSKIAGQLAYEKQKVSEGYSVSESRKLFRKRYGESYL